MRLFIAIELSEEMKKEIIRSQRILKSDMEEGRLTQKENLHITVVFLGEVAENRIGLIKETMNRIQESPFLLQMKGLGRFSKKGGDLWYREVSLDSALLRIYDILSRELKRNGFQIEDRRFSPHITIARQVKCKKKQEISFTDVMQPVDSLSLMKSEQIKGKMVYTPIYKKILTPI